MARKNSNKSTKKNNSSPWDVLQINQDEVNPPKKATKTKANDLFFSNNQSELKEHKDLNDTKKPDIPEIIFTKHKVAVKPEEVFTKNDDLENTKVTFRAKMVKRLATLKMLKFNFSFRNWQKQTKESTLLILVLLLLTIGMYWFISPASMLQTVEVTGNVDLKPNTVMNAANLKMNRSIFRIIGHEKQIAQTAYDNNEQIDKLVVSVLSPTKVKLVVKESIKAGFVLKNNKYYLVLGNGKILPRGYENPKPGYPIYDNFNTSQLKQVVKGISQLSRPIRSAISEMKIVDTKDDSQKLILYMNDGNQVYAKLATFGDKMAYYPSIAAQMKTAGIVDLQVGAYSYSYEQQKAQLAATKTAKDSKKKLTKSNKAKTSSEKNKTSN